MRITFESIFLKNFLSFGNNETFFSYQPGINLVYGVVEGQNTRNGIGKSALLIDAINFALFGKPARSKYHINQNDLINITNKSDCLVTISFRIGENSYQISRGLKPNILNIFKNGEKVSFPSKKDAESYIENIIGVNQTSFSNIITLNINTSKPFLELEPKSRREILENLFSTHIYTKILINLKNKHSNIQFKIKILENEIENIKKNIEFLKTNIEELEEQEKTFAHKKEKTISLLHNEIRELENEYQQLQSKVDGDIDNIKQKILSLKEKIKDTDEKILVLTKKEISLKEQNKKYFETLKLLKNNDICPVCHTRLSHSLDTQEYIKQIQESIESNSRILEEIVEKKKKGEDYKNQLTIKVVDFEEKMHSLQTTIHKIQIIKTNIENKKKILEKEINSTINVNKAPFEENIKNLQKELEQKKNELQQNRLENEIIEYNLNKLNFNTGIVNFILSKTVPILNNKINNYLKSLGSEYAICLDASLSSNELINPIGITRSYENLSSGEKKRVDIAVLFALTDLAKMYNSFDSNIIILDEILDTSLDEEGIDNLLSLLKNEISYKNPDKCIYIITHRSDIESEIFDRVIKLKKVHGFTLIDEIKNK